MSAGDLVEAAVAVVQAEGVEAFGVSRVAREVGIRPASMYNHFESGEALAKAVAREGTRRLTAAMKAAVRGVFEPRKQLQALAHAFRSWARANPGLYALMDRVEPEVQDPEASATMQELLDLFDRPLGQLGLAEAKRVHAMRSFRSAIHGFAMLETSSQFQLPAAIEESFGWMVEALIRGVADSASVS